MFLLLGLRFVTRIFISVLFWILVDLEDNPDFVDYIYIYIYIMVVFNIQICICITFIL